MKGSLLFIFLIQIIFLSCTRSSNDHTCALSKELPKLIEGCEGNGCAGVLENLPAKKDVTLYETRDINSKVVGKINDCEKFSSLKQFLIIDELVKAQVVGVDEDFKKRDINLGDSIYLMHVNTNGKIVGCAGNEIITDMNYKSEGEENKKNSKVIEILGDAKLYRVPKAPWVQVTNARGITGWTPGGFENVFWLGEEGGIPKNDLKHCKK